MKTINIFLNAPTTPIGWVDNDYDDNDHDVDDWVKMMTMTRVMDDNNYDCYDCDDSLLQMTQQYYIGQSWEKPYNIFNSLNREFVGMFIIIHDNNRFRISIDITPFKSNYLNEF